MEEYATRWSEPHTNDAWGRIMRETSETAECSSSILSEFCLSRLSFLQVMKRTEFKDDVKDRGRPDTVPLSIMFGGRTSVPHVGC